MTPESLLKQHFGYDRFRPGQRQIIDHVMAGRDGLVIMPTGGGKSLCFQLPALMLPGLTLVVSPLISLMKDQVDGLNAVGIPAAFINSTISPGEIARIQGAALAGQLKLVYVAPERFAAPSFSAFLGQIRLSLLAVDEAHCISEWGHDFRPDYRNLRAVRQRFAATPVLALTATATEQVRRDIIAQLGLASGSVFVSSFDRPNLAYSVWPKKQSLPKMVALLRASGSESAIVYCSSRAETERLAAQFREQGFKARAYHAGLDSRERGDVQEQFIRDDVKVVVATIAFGMGIDKPDVRLVIHYNLPRSVEGYYQETGRAGRDGLPSRCVLFYSYGDRQRHAYMIGQLTEPLEQAKALDKLDHVVRYCESGACRRRFLLDYFGERYRGGTACGACDACDPGLGASRAVEAAVRRKGGPAAAPVADGDPALFERLRSRRKQLADERGVPAYVIFGDRTLHELAAAKPRTKAAMAGVFGIGAKRLEDFGEAFAEVIRAYDSGEPPPGGDDGAAAPDEDRPNAAGVVRELLAAGLSPDEIAASRGVKLTTVLGHMEKLVAAGEELELSRVPFDAARLEKIRQAFADADTDKLAPVRERLGDGYGWDELRLARLVIRGR
jgi:RecQ family ATP-dependent DNA helicase